MQSICDPQWLRGLSVLLSGGGSAGGVEGGRWLFCLGFAMRLLVIRHFCLKRLGDNIR